MEPTGGNKTTVYMCVCVSAAYASFHIRVCMCVYDVRVAARRTNNNMACKTCIHNYFMQWPGSVLHIRAYASDVVVGYCINKASKTYEDETHRNRLYGLGGFEH